MEMLNLSHLDIIGMRISFRGDAYLAWEISSCLEFRRDMDFVMHFFSSRKKNRETRPSIVKKCGVHCAIIYHRSRVRS